MKGYWVLKGLKILVLLVFFVALFGTAVMWLWNWLMPNLFNLPYISFSQAIGLTVLTRILSGGFRSWAWAWVAAVNIGNKNAKCGKNGRLCHPKNVKNGKKIGAAAANIVVGWVLKTKKTKWVATKFRIRQIGVDTISRKRSNFLGFFNEFFL